MWLFIGYGLRDMIFIYKDARSHEHKILHTLSSSLFGECYTRPQLALHNILQFAQTAPFNVSYYSHNRQHFCPYGIVTVSSL